MDWKRVVSAWCVVGAVAPASAADDVHWVCGLSDDGIRLVCVVDADDALDAAPGPAPAAAAMVNGTRFPLDRNQAYIVDLWSPPTELAAVKLLAQATICYRSPGCTVTLAPGPWLASLRDVPPSRFAGTRRRPQ